MNKKYTMAFLLITVFFITIVNAGVNLKNGNFYISYTDVEFDKSFQVERTYNSKSVETGIFGSGWGSEIEVHLLVLPDKSIMVFENGSGGKTRFKISNQDNSSYLEGVKKIVAVAKRLEEIKTPEEEKKLEESLKSNVEKLTNYWNKYRKKGLVESPEIPVGTVLESNERGFQTIKIMPDGFLRIWSSKKDFFNKKGLLTRVTGDNSESKTLTYDDNENLSTVTDHLGRKLTFTFNTNGTVAGIESQNGETIKRADYKYDGTNLIETTDTGGNNYKYEYDDKYNMTKIRYIDGTSVDIAYHPKTLFVKSIKDKNGSLTTYDYGSDPQAPDDHYWTTTKKYDSENKLLVENSYEYFIKSVLYGSRYTSKIITVVNGIKTDTDYDKNGTPISIKRSEAETGFKYDTGGRLIRKETRREIIEIKYDERHFKIARVDTTDKATGNKTWNVFKYDLAGNLIYAENSDGNTVALTYDDKKKISSMLDNSKRLLKFKYNERGKPTEISMEADGKPYLIQVQYDEQGEIAKVESPQGHSSALMVTQAFQNLLTIVKPAGVNLNF